jgi:hypothetical protein
MPVSGGRVNPDYLAGGFWAGSFGETMRRTIIALSPTV